MSNFWKLLFVPHEHNNHRAQILRPTFIGVFIALYILNQSIIKSLTIAKPGVLGYSSEITAQKVLDMTNSERQRTGQPLLKYNAVLSRSATDKANDMFAQNYWAHNSPTGTTPWDFFKKEGYKYSIAGENLAKDFYDTDSLMKAWMNSPTHRANIVNPKYQEIGIGVVNGVLNGVKTTLVVQHFASPTSGVVQSSTDSLPELVVSSVQNSVPLISPLQISQVVGSIIFIVLISALAIDAYITYKNKTHRLTGSSVGHIGFIAIIFILLIATRGGTIF